MDETTQRRKSALFILLSLAVSLAITCFGAWLKGTSGFDGFLKYNLSWTSIYNGVLYSSWISVFLMLLYAGFVERNRRTAIVLRAVSLFYSALLLLASICGFLYFSAIGAARTGALAPLSILPPGDSLPDRSLDAGKYEPLLTFAVTSDPLYGDESANADARTETLKSIKARGYDAVFILGNISHFGLDTESYRLAADELSEIMEGQQLRLVMGGNDALINNKNRFMRNFAGGMKDLYYRIDAGPVHIIVLNLLWDASEFTSRQKEWLVRQLEPIPQTDTVIVLSHSFLASSGNKTSTGKLAADITDLMGRVCPILDKYHVDLVVSGRNHFMEYLERHNVSYAVVGALGAPLEEKIAYISPWSKWLNNKSHGWLEVAVYEDFFIMTFYASDGTVLTQLAKDTIVEE